MQAFDGKYRGTGDLKKLVAAIKDVPHEMTKMLKDSRHYKGISASFDKYDLFLAIVEKRFPIVNFSI